MSQPVLRGQVHGFGVASPRLYCGAPGAGLSSATLEVPMLRSCVRWCGLLLLGSLLLLSLASLYGPSHTPAFGGSPLSSHQMTAVVFPSSSSSVIGGPSLSASF